MKASVENGIDVKERNSSVLTSSQSRLFQLLRELRHQIAKEQDVPAFIIFSDSTLTDMCIRRPRNDREFLELSGVGQYKLERYGSCFLQLIEEFLEDENECG